MVTNDKVRVRKEDVNTRDAKRVGVWFLVVSALTVIGLLQLGDAHAPAPPNPEVQEAIAEHQYTHDFDINHSAGVIEWPGMVGEKTHYLSGQGNTPATQEQTQAAADAAKSAKDKEAPAASGVPAAAGH